MGLLVGWKSVKKKSGQGDVERRHRFILGKLAGVPDISMLEIGFSATPQALRSMAASGLIRVRVEITHRGRERLQKLVVKADTRKFREAAGLNMPGRKPRAVA